MLELKGLYMTVAVWRLWQYLTVLLFFRINNMLDVGLSYFFPLNLMPTQFFCCSFLIIATACQTFLQRISCFNYLIKHLLTSLHVFACRRFLLPVDNHAVLCSLKLTALTHVVCVFPATVTRLVPSRLTAMRQANVAASLVSPGPNVTAVLEDFSTSRRAAAHVSITSQATNRRFLQRVNSVWTHKWCFSTSWENKST